MADEEQAKPKPDYEPPAGAETTGTWTAAGVSIGYTAHDADTVQLYMQETLTFLVYTAEASVALTPS